MLAAAGAVLWACCGLATAAGSAIRPARRRTNGGSRRKPRGESSLQGRITVRPLLLLVVAFGP